VKPEAVELLLKAKECAIEAGVYDKMFLSFGTLLGAIRPTKNENHKYRLGLMEHDDDMDIGWLPMKLEEKKEYFQRCASKGLFKWDFSGRHSTMNGDLLWFSIKDDEHVRSCNWFFFEWDDYMWHSKGFLWLNEIKFPIKSYPRSEKATGLMLGAPAVYFNAGLKEIEFEHERFNVPLFAGSLCDFWYPGWAQPRKGGASSKQICGIINNWEDKSTWEHI